MYPEVDEQRMGLWQRMIAAMMEPDPSYRIGGLDGASFRTIETLLRRHGW